MRSELDLDAARGWRYTCVVARKGLFINSRTVLGRSSLFAKTGPFVRGNRPTLGLEYERLI